MTFQTLQNHSLASFLPHAGNLISGVSNGALFSGTGAAGFSASISNSGGGAFHCAPPLDPNEGTDVGSLGKKESGAEQFDRLNAEIQKDPNASWFMKKIVFSPVGRDVNIIGVPVMDFLTKLGGYTQSPSTETVKNYLDSKVDSLIISKDQKLIIKTYIENRLENK